MARLFTGLMNGYIWMLVGLVVFGFVGCGIDRLVGRGIVFFWPPDSDVPDGATRFGLLLMLVWSMTTFGYGCTGTICGRLKNSKTGKHRNCRL